MCGINATVASYGSRRTTTFPFSICIVKWERLRYMYLHFNNQFSIFLKFGSYFVTDFQLTNRISYSMRKVLVPLHRTPSRLFIFYCYLISMDYSIPVRIYLPVKLADSYYYHWHEPSRSTLMNSQKVSRFSEAWLVNIFLVCLENEARTQRTNRRAQKTKEGISTNSLLLARRFAVCKFGFMSGSPLGSIPAWKANMAPPAAGPLHRCSLLLR